MAKNKQETTTVRVYKKALPILGKLSLEKQKTQVEYLTQALLFLNKTGIDVFAKDLIDIPNLIKKLDNRMVSFMKKREQDLFIPMQKTFLEQVDLLKNVMIGLENFDVINFINKEGSLEKNKPKNSLIIPDNFKEEKTPFLMEEKQNILDDFSPEKLYDCEELFVEVEELKNQNKIYIKNIEFLLKNIRQGSALSGVKFIINIQQNDIKRIENLIK